MKATKASTKGASNEPSSFAQCMFRPEYRWYSVGVAVRIIWTLLYPQRGYIHPDEFFQGPEVVFDDIFGGNLTRTHEFNSAAPLRSVAVLYLLYGLPAAILSVLSSTFHWSSIPFHLKLVFPRTVILLLSLGTDILFARLIKRFYPDFKSKERGTILNYYGIAHVTLVFFTRTLSNSFEAFLFLTLVYLIDLNVSSLLAHSVDSPARTTLTSWSIGFICALGIFNRPTFPAFALVPLAYWFMKIIPTVNHSSHFQLLLSRTISLIVGAFALTSGALILFDSYYYNDGWSFIVDLKTRLVICPVNFILYNVDATKLEEHGLHPAWLHFLVNATILYGPLHWCLVIWCLSRVPGIRRSIADPALRAQPERHSPLWLLYLYLIPFLPLSTFPHQEPRFLLPLLFPLVLFTVPLLITHRLHRTIFRLWIGFNICVAVLFGHLHQGGLLPALQHVHDLPASNQPAVKTLITYHTYMPPGYLVSRMSQLQSMSNVETTIIDLRGGKREKLAETVDKHFSSSAQVFVVVPSICRADLVDSRQQRYSFRLVQHFGAHLDLDHAFDGPLDFASVQSIRERFQLDLYQVI